MYYNRSFFAACRLSFLILTGFCLSACFDNEDTTDPVQTLVTIAQPAISLGYEDYWVYATNAGGYVLDVQNTVGNESLTLSSKTPVDKFNLTHW
ncbi:MAG: hypothetical protein QM762_18255 [Chryseolinea sp.]